MENHNAMLGSGGGAKAYPNTNNNATDEQVQNPDPNRPDELQEESIAGSLDSAQPPPPPDSAVSVARQSSRTPFTNLNQVDADLALARTLQEQERAYMMLRMNNEGSDYGSWEAGSYLHDDEDDFNDFHDDTDADDDDDDDEEFDGTDVENDADAFDMHAHDDDDVEDDNPNVELDPAGFSSDEAYARALQDAEDREMAARLLALADLNDVEDADDHGVNSQETWEEVDPDELSYEELLALGEVVGTESRGLSADSIASLPSVNYKTGSSQIGSNDSRDRRERVCA
nr:E3 ubiquitin ligase BIG BROTHER-related-like isoform X2 [Ziziphus jujuba var. spinosa]